jgi:NOL1/NOP2/fmu family ribosome biogenesis protein
MKLKILSKKEIKRIFSMIKQQFGADAKLKHAFLQDKDGKLFMVNRDVSRIDLSKLRVNSIGMEFGAVRDGILLSIEASQMVGPLADRNIVEFDKKDAKRWLAGEELDYSGDIEGYVLIRSGEDFLGTGRIKEKKIMNFIPKPRRLKTTELI